MLIGLVLETFQFIRSGIFGVVLFLYAEKKSWTYKTNYLTTFYAPNSTVVLITEEFSAVLSVT